MKKLTRVFMIVLVLLITSSSPTLAGIWSSTSMSVLYGSGYELASSENATIFTLEHASGWAYGDNFLFLDMFQPFDNGTSLYCEWHPRFSSRKILGNEEGYGFVKDILLASELNVGANMFAETRIYLFGLGLDLDIPHFSFFSLNLFLRDDVGIQDSPTFQISPSWNIPFEVGGLKWTFGGFLDYAGAEGDYSEAQLLTCPQLLLDVSNLMDAPGNMYLGIEYQYWKNKYGNDGVDESVVQFMGKWFF